MQATLPATLPTTLQEATALQFAHNFIDKLRDLNFWNTGVDPWHPDAGRLWLRQLIQFYVNFTRAGEGRAILFLMAVARAGSEEADTFLRDMFTEQTHRNEEPSPFLKTYIAEVLNQPIKVRPGPKNPSNMAADITIATLVSMLTEPPYNLNPTRGLSKRRLSRCSVAAQALTERGMHRGGEKAIAKIWQRFGPAIAPTGR